MAISLLVNQGKNLLVSQVSNHEEDIQLIWLNENPLGRILTMKILAEMNRNVKPCSKQQVFLIVFGPPDTRLLSQINKYHQVLTIFINSTNPQNDYNKMDGNSNNQKNLLKIIDEKILIEKQNLAISVFDAKQKSLKDLSKESASFLWNQMLIYVLKQMPLNEQSKQQMISLCQNYYQDKKGELENIQEFENDKRNKAIEWYTKEGFFYKLLNKALRTEDIELIYIFRFFIIGLCAEIEEESKSLKDTGMLTLYRGIPIPNTELEKLEENDGQIISFNGLFSTSRFIDVAIRFSHPDEVSNGFAAVLFEIHADSSLKSISFADVDKKTQSKGEGEVLFNLNPVFEVHTIVFDKKLKLWKVQLNTTDKGSEKVQEYLTLAKQDMEECSPIIYFGGLLLVQLGQVDRAEIYFQMLLQSLPSDHKEIASVYNNLGNVYFQKGELDLALMNYEKSYEIRQKRLSSNHSHIASSLRNIGIIHRSNGDYDNALSYCQKALLIKEKTSPGNNLHKAMIIESIGLVYTDKKDFDTALTNIFDALHMYKQVLSEPHPSIALCLGNIGYVYKEKRDFRRALDYYDQQLEMEEQCLPFDHSNLSIHLEWIVDIYKQMNQIDQGLKICNEKFHEQKNKLGENHFCISRTLNIMGDTIVDIDPKRALKYYENALSIVENCASPDPQAIRECLKRMAYVYSKLNMLASTLRCYFEILDINYQMLFSKHVEIANILNSIGSCFQELKKPSKALRYYNERLSIHQTNNGLQHEAVKQVEENVAVLNIS